MAKRFEREGTRTPPLPEFPTDAVPGTLQKLKVMEYRVQQGCQPHHPDDRKAVRTRAAVNAGDDDADDLSASLIGLLTMEGEDHRGNRGARIVEAGEDVDGKRKRTRDLPSAKQARRPGQYYLLRKAAAHADEDEG